MGQIPSHPSLSRHLWAWHDGRKFWQVTEDAKSVWNSKQNIFKILEPFWTSDFKRSYCFVKRKGNFPTIHTQETSVLAAKFTNQVTRLDTRTWFVAKVSLLIFLCTNWQCSTSLMYIGTLVVTLAACPYLFQLDWLSQSCVTAVCVWSCFLISVRLRCRKILNNGTLSNFVWNSTNLPQRYLLL